MKANIIKKNICVRYPLIADVFISCLFFIITSFNLFTFNIWAQDIGAVTREIDVLVNKEVIETFRFQESMNGTPGTMPPSTMPPILTPFTITSITVTPITVTIEPDDFITLSVIKQDEKFEVKSGDSVDIDGEGKITFIIRGGENGGKGIITLNSDDLNISEQIPINVLGVEAKFTVDDDDFVIEVNSRVTFTDTSKPAGDVKTREWDFGDGSEISNEQNPMHVFTTQGAFNVSLEITAETEIGDVTDETSTVICVIPRSVSGGVPELEGFGSILGTVFRADKNTPVIGATVTLIGTSGNRAKATDGAGSYRFRVIQGGFYTMTACGVNFDCSTIDVTVLGNGDQQVVNFVINNVD